MRWLLIRGLSRDARHWGSFPQTFAEELGVEVQTIDPPGFGTQITRTSPSTIAKITDDIRDRATIQGGDWSILGISLGGMVTPRLGCPIPERVSTCSRDQHLGIQCGAAARTRTAGVHEGDRDGGHPRDIGKPERFERVVLGLSSNRPADELEEPGKQSAKWQHEATPSRASVLGQPRAATRFKLPTNITTPLLVLTATNDQLVSHRCSDEIARKLRAPIRTHPAAGTTSSASPTNRMPCDAGHHSAADRAIASCMPRVASSSASSLSATPACPFTQNHSTRCRAQAAWSRCQRSTFFTGCFAAVIQPLRSQPPGPGLGLHPPSVWMTTTSSSMRSVRPCLPEQPHSLGPDAVKGEAVEIRRQVRDGAVTGVEERQSRVGRSGYRRRRDPRGRPSAEDRHSVDGWPRDSRGRADDVDLDLLAGPGEVVLAQSKELLACARKLLYHQPSACALRIRVKGAAQMTIGHLPGLRYSAPSGSARQQLPYGTGRDGAKRKMPNPAQRESLSSHLQLRR
jgi:pimeloyl-ACP methyl ester carboxylesterase